MRKPLYRKRVEFLRLIRQPLIIEKTYRNTIRSSPRLSRLHVTPPRGLYYSDAADSLNYTYLFFRSPPSQPALYMDPAVEGLDGFNVGGNYKQGAPLIE